MEGAEYAKNEFMGNPFNKFFEREIIVKNKLKFNEALRYGEDENFFLEYIQYISAIRTIGKANYNYFYRDNSAVTKKYDTETYLKIITYLNDFRRKQLVFTDTPDFRQRYTSFVNQYLRSIKGSHQIKIKENYNLIDKRCIEQESKFLKFVFLFFRKPLLKLFVYLFYSRLK
ncbi:hypothetical protein JSO59_008300 [Riemerella anatipestifer]|uniref:hypothetical protein n=1 Tax=Riemerella anatipestifer TaxID=34085 RepID=UPI0030C2FAEC